MRMMNKFLLLTFLLVAQVSFAQTRQTTEREQTFLAYFNAARLSEHWGTWLDVHYRQTGNFFDRPFLGIARLGGTYFFNNDVRFTAAYAYVHGFPDAGFKTAKPEHRPWQQLWWRNKYKKLQTIQQLRLEQRFVQRVVNDVALDEYAYSNRIRYAITLSAPLRKKGAETSRLSAVLNNELFINFGANIIYNHFDQNRFFAGFAWNFTPDLSAQFGYMNVFQQTAAGDRFFNNHCIRLYFLQNLDFRKSDP